MSTTLVFGASPNPNRYSNLAVRRFLENKVDTVAFGIRAGKIGDIQITNNLGEIPNIDTVTLYLRGELQKQYYDALIALGPRRIIFNPGTENPEFYRLLEENGIDYEIACTLVLLGTGQY